MCFVPLFKVDMLEFLRSYKMYKLLNVDIGNNKVEQHIILDRGNGEFTSFPAEESNPNYQVYLKWLEAGNTPLPADTGA